MNRLRRNYTVAWVGWLAAFGVIEACALRHEHGGTLSEHTRAALGMRHDSDPLHKIMGIAALSAFAIWVVPHLLNDPHIFELDS